MTDQAWRRKLQLFDEVLERPAAERARFLDDACAGNPALRTEIEDLIAFHESGTGILDRDSGIKRLHAELSDDLLPGDRIGVFEIVGTLGEGGMGIVYEASQDEPVRRRVALKLVRRGMDSAALIRRFEAERQALALMTHRTVAKVFDGGTAPDGRPYFAMELVEGTPLTTYCDRENLDVRARLELFLEICAGVEHAHRSGIIHRDLKPSNIIVTLEDDRPLPKIIDFGIAKAFAEGLVDSDAGTAVGTWVGTPDYMSPEQARGSGVDTRTDVYTLGVLLYELLVGSLPFDPGELREDGAAGIQRMITQDDPRRPSVRFTELDGGTAVRAASCRGTDPRSLARALSGDLDWIAMKALEKDREERYGSVGELAADLGRHLRDEPVVAGPPRPLYRARKFVRRHRVGSAFAATLALLLVGFAITMGVQARRIAAERDRANAAADRATQASEQAALEARTSRRVADFLVGLFEVSGPGESRGNEVTAREILDRGAANVREELAGEPEVRARILFTMGKVYRQLGLYEPALELHQEALDGRRAALGEAHRETAESLAEIAHVLENTGRSAEAVGYIEQALAALEAAEDATDTDFADALVTYSTIRDELGDYAEAQSLAEQAAARYERVDGPDSARVAAQLSWAAQMAGVQGNYEEGRAASARALAIMERILGPDHPNLGAHVNGLAILNWQLGDYEAARPLFERFLRMTEELFGPDHPRTAAALNNYGRVLTDMGAYDEARTPLVRSMEIRADVFGPEHVETATSILNLGRLLALTGEIDEALELYARGVAIREEGLGPDHPLLAMALEGYADVLRRGGDEEAAAAAAARAASIRGR